MKSSGCLRLHTNRSRDISTEHSPNDLSAVTIRPCDILKPIRSVQIFLSAPGWWWPCCHTWWRQSSSTCPVTWCPSCHMIFEHICDIQPAVKCNVDVLSNYIWHTWRSLGSVVWGMLWGWRDCHKIKTLAPRMGLWASVFVFWVAISRVRLSRDKYLTNPCAGGAMFNRCALTRPFQINCHTEKKCYISWRNWYFLSSGRYVTAVRQKIQNKNVTALW
jgi:hypothetical protein